MRCTYEFDPAAHDSTSLTDTWSCPHEQHPSSEYCLFHMGPEKRDENGISSQAVTTAIIQKLKDNNDTKRAFIGAQIPSLDLDYVDVESDDQHPADFRHTTIPGGISIHHGRFEEQLDLRHSTIGGLNAANCDFENGILCAETTFTGTVNLFEAIVTGDNTDFTDAVFTDLVTVDEADFSDDVWFTDATFQDEASFKGTQFYGHTNATRDNTDFSGAVFETTVSFLHATFESTDFRDVVFNEDAVFKKANANGTVIFTGSEFAGAADFDEVIFNEDVLFDDTVFQDGATFRGVEFNGGAALLEDDVSFETATFGGSVTFEKGKFGYSNFKETTFDDDVVFKRGTFIDDATFEDATFAGVTDFDEVLFDGDCNFTNTVFRKIVTFRGTEFNGGTNYVKDDAIFQNATFVDNVDFRNASFTSADFMNTSFKASADFTETDFSESLHLKATSFGDDTYLNFTDAAIADGRIIQPENGWVRFDMTKATIGTVELSAENPADERELLDYVRFCDTTFNKFNFAEHTSYLDRNNWDLHSFDGGTRSYDFAVEMTPNVIEKTYLKAKNSASSQSNVKAAGEFRVKRQQHARRKFFEIATDTGESLVTRGRNWLRGIENLFLGLSCGYGLRLYRITTVFILFPLVAGFLFAIGGPQFETGAGQIALVDLATFDGLHTLGINMYFSYITFLTIGYGNIGPIGLGARFTSAILVYMNVILAGLFLYALIKRSEI